MLKIGITGGIGSGKTTVCKIFEVLNVPVYYADDAAKQLMNTDDGLISEIKAHFGHGAYREGSLDRKYIANIVFNDPAKLAQLNELVHPAVFRDFEVWSAGYGSPYVVKEAALLFESGSYRLCDKSILVTAPQQLRLERVMLRDGLTEEEVVKRMKKQHTEERNRELADYLISNEGRSLVVPQVIALHNLFVFGAETA